MVFEKGLRRLRAGLTPKFGSQIRNTHNFSEESRARYCPGGYHAVRIGDEFNSGTYKVVSKLGYGAYSTVWLARNLRTNQHVALKILTADSFGSGKDTFEIDILRHLASKSKDPSTGSCHVLGLLDEFRHTGPNGQHACLVFKAMGPDLSKYWRLFPRLRIPVAAAKIMTKQLLTALAFLHDTRVIHTDIKPQNVLVETTEINEMFEHAPSYVFQPQSPPLDPPNDYYMQSEQVSSAGEDLAASTDIHVRLTDFGTSSWFDRHLTEWIQPPMLRAPEVILGAEWDYKVDIWNLGLVIWELVHGQLVFDGQATATAEYSSEAHLSQMMAILGPMPETLLGRSRLGSKYFENGQLVRGPTFTPRPLEKLSQNVNIAEGDKKDLEDMIGSMLRLEPRERPDARELLTAKWLAGV